MRFAGTQLSSYLDPSNFDNIAKSSMEARTTERNADMISKAHVQEADIMGDAAVKAAKFGASATVAQGAAQGQSSMFSGLGNMASGIAGGFANRPTPTVPKPTPSQAIDAGTFFAQPYINRQLINQTEVNYKVMTSSYGSRFRARSGDVKPRFAGPAITGGPNNDYGQAADTVSLAGSYGSLRKTAPKFDEISATAMAARASERATQMTTDAQVEAAGITADANVKSAKIQAKAAKSAASKEASGSMMGSALGAIGSIGGALIGLSDATTKNDIKPIEDALTTLRQLRPVTFYYKEEWSTSPERMHHGFIAQEYQEVVPDATYYDSNNAKYCIDTGDLIGLLVRAVQQLETKVTRLEAANALVGVK